MSKIQKMENHFKANEESDEDDVLLGRGITAFRLIVFISAVALFFYFLKFGDKGWSSQQDIWGQFGDYIGGILNPFIGGVTVYLVLVNVRLQKKELKASLIEMRNSNTALAIQNTSIVRQNFEQTFFAWLSSYRDLVSSVTYTSRFTDEPSSGRDALYSIWNDFLGQNALARVLVNNPLTPGAEYTIYLKHATVPNEKKDAVKHTILEQWEKAYSGSQHHVDSMFRTLYRLIKWIDEQADHILDHDQKWHYVSIIRAQISHIEMVYLFFNGFTNRGENFNKCINKYAIFDNFDPNFDSATQFLMTIQNPPFANQAFQSSLARNT